MFVNVGRVVETHRDETFVWPILTIIGTFARKLLPLKPFPNLAIIRESTSVVRTKKSLRANISCDLVFNAIKTRRKLSCQKKLHSEIICQVMNTRM